LLRFQALFGAKRRKAGTQWQVFSLELGRASMHRFDRLVRRVA